jgi:hypothetical protein
MICPCPAFRELYTGGTFGTAKDWGWSPGTSGRSNDPQPASSKTGGDGGGDGSEKRIVKRYAIIKTRDQISKSPIVFKITPHGVTGRWGWEYSVHPKRKRGAHI